MDRKVKGQLRTEPLLWTQESMRLTHKIYDDDDDDDDDR
jgi:hypothetical protein